MEATHANYCLILCRVSTLKQAQQGESIEVQEKICTDIARRYNAQVLRVFREYYSGRKDKRLVVEDIFDCIKQNPGKIGMLVIRGIDRMTRAGTTSYDQLKSRLASYGVRLVDSYGTIQPVANTLAHLGVEYDWSRVSPSEITELILAYQGKKEVTDILTRMVGAEIELVRNGYKVRPSNDGYRNKTIFVDGKRKVIQEADPGRAPFYIQMFRLRESGAYTDKEIVGLINSMGFRTRVHNRWSRDKSKVVGQGGGVPLSVKQLQAIIRNPIYCAVNTEKWLPAPIKTKYEGLVGIETFNRANKGKVYIEVLQGGTVRVHHNYAPLHFKRLRNNPDFPFRFILCPHCRSPLCGSSPTGKSGQRFPAYHCSRNHPYYHLKQSSVHQAMAGFVAGLKFKDGFTECLELSLLSKYRERQGELSAFVEKAQENMAALEMLKKQKIDAYASTQNQIIRAGLEKDIEALQGQINLTDSQKDKIQITGADIRAFVGYAKNLMEHPEKLLLDKDNINRMKALYTLVFDETPDYTEIANGTPKLSLVFRLSKGFEGGRSGMVPLRDFSWNTAEAMIKKWNSLLGE